MQLALAGCALSSPPELNTRADDLQNPSLLFPAPPEAPHTSLMLPQFNQGMEFHSFPALQQRGAARQSRGRSGCN